MKLKKIKIGKLVCENNLILAPLAGYTNAVFRRMCMDLGASLSFTEMISARGLCYDNKKTADMLIKFGVGGLEGCQLFGSEPEIMRRACESEYLKDFELIDINMGCPMPKIYNNGEGSALLNDFRLASKIISECKKSGKIISVKFRIGLREDNIISSDFAKLCEDSGADMITVHGRTRDKIYSGGVNYKAIEDAKKSVKIPVIANGGVFTADDFYTILDKTGADGVAVARGAMYSPFLFAEITGRKVEDKKSIILKQLYDTKELFGERFACVYMRKMIGFYLHGIQNAAKLREELFKADSCEKVEKLLLNVDIR